MQPKKLKSEKVSKTLFSLKQQLSFEVWKGEHGEQPRPYFTVGTYPGKYRQLYGSCICCIYDRYKHIHREKTQKEHAPACTQPLYHTRLQLSVTDLDGRCRHQPPKVDAFNSGIGVPRGKNKPAGDEQRGNGADGHGTKQIFVDHNHEIAAHKLRVSVERLLVAAPHKQLSIA
jgi:hypothetical protein